MVGDGLTWAEAIKTQEKERAKPTRLSKMHLPAELILILELFFILKAPRFPGDRQASAD
jgi:hypothetical protein